MLQWMAALGEVSVVVRRRWYFDEGYDEVRALRLMLQLAEKWPPARVYLSGADWVLASAKFVLL